MTLMTQGITNESRNGLCEAAAGAHSAEGLAASGLPRRARITDGVLSQGANASSDCLAGWLAAMGGRDAESRADSCDREFGKVMRDAIGAAGYPDCLAA